MITNNDEDYIHYLYKITNLTNGKYYYGIHSLPKLENKEPLKDGYWGSGTGITEDIKKLGKEKFKKEIIKTFSTRQEASDMERSIVTMEEINKSECYNRIPGGDTYVESMIGRVVCRPKDNVDKIVVLTKEEYYNNKDKYFPVGHKRYFLESNSNNKIRKSNYVKTQKKDENDTLFCRVRYFVNKDTLEVKKFIGHDEPDKLYDTWFPIYFLDEVNNKFITLEYFEELYDKFHNLEKIARYLNKKDKRKIKELRDYYISKGLDLSSKTKGKRGYATTSGFSGKCIVHNNSEQLVINREDLNKYMAKGYSKGKLKIIPEADIIDYYTKGNNMKNCAKKFSISSNKIKEILKIDKTFEIRIYHNSEGKVIRLFVNKEYHEKLLSNGWMPGWNK